MVELVETTTIGFFPTADVSTGSTSAFHPQDTSVVEPAVAELVEVLKRP